VLQERRFERVGGSRTLEVDVRWVAATNRELRAMIDAGAFREDLYHRLAVFPIKLPPLRERRSDLIPIAKNLLVRIAADLKRAVPTLTAAAEQRLLASTWRGNVRELANALERAAILADGATIDASHIWLDEPAKGSPSGGGGIRPLAELEHDAILAALEAVSGNRRKAAELLGIGERTLYDKLKKYGVE
jgi:two-component system, NtrC family, response regulator AtoC